MRKREGKILYMDCANAILHSCAADHSVTAHVDDDAECTTWNAQGWCRVCHERCAVTLLLRCKPQAATLTGYACPHVHAAMGNPKKHVQLRDGLAQVQTKPAHDRSVCTNPYCSQCGYWRV